MVHITVVLAAVAVVALIAIAAVEIPYSYVPAPAPETSIGATAYGQVLTPTQASQILGYQGTGGPFQSLHYNKTQAQALFEKLATQSGQYKNVSSVVDGWAMNYTVSGSEQSVTEVVFEFNSSDGVSASSMYQATVSSFEQAGIEFTQTGLTTGRLTYSYISKSQVITLLGYDGSYIVLAYVDQPTSAAQALPTDIAEDLG